MRKNIEMAIREILTYPNKILRQPTRPVETIDEEIRQIIEDMAETMYDAPGLGLAAIQIGVDRSIIVYDISPKEEGRHLEVLINPKITHTEGTLVSEDEGCLSVPDFKSDVKRAAAIRVEALDREGNPITIETDDFQAIVLQHEIDHLNGILFIDHISSLKRNMYKRRVKKGKK